MGMWRELTWFNRNMPLSIPFERFIIWIHLALVRQKKLFVIQSISMSHVYPSTSQLPNFTVSNAVAICFRQPMLCRFQTYAAGMFGFMKMHRTLVWLHSWGNTWDHEMASRYDQWLSPTNSPHRPCGHQNSSCTTTWCVEMGSHPVVMAKGLPCRTHHFVVIKHYKSGVHGLLPQFLHLIYFDFLKSYHAYSIHQ